MPTLIISPYKTLGEIISRNSSREPINTLIHTICDYDPLFKQAYQKLCDQIADVINENKFVIQQFKEALTMIQNKITNIKKISLSTKNELTGIRNDLSFSIRTTETKLDQLEEEKVGLQGQKEVLEQQIRQQEADLKKIWILPIAGILLAIIRAAFSILDTANLELKNTEEKIRSLTTEKNHTLQLLKESTAALNTNLRLTTACNTLQNNITNILTSIKRIKNLSSLKNKLIALEKDWTTLMNIVNVFIIDAELN